MLTEMVFLLLMVLGVGLWLDAKRQHEHALANAHRLCASQDVQLLDQTVAMAGMRLRRQRGFAKLERHYTFEVSVRGSDRISGKLWLIQGQLAGFSAPWLKPEDPVMHNAQATVTSLLDRIAQDRAPRP